MSEHQFIKNEDGTLKVVRTTPVAETENSYDFDFLTSQELSIIAQRDAFVAAREVELVEVRALLAACAELGIVSKVVVEPIVP